MKQQPTRRGFLDWVIGLGSAITGAALLLPSLMYLWPAAKGGGGSCGFRSPGTVAAGHPGPVLPPGPLLWQRLRRKTESRD